MSKREKRRNRAGFSDMAETEKSLNDIESGAPKRYN